MCIFFTAALFFAFIDDLQGFYLKIVKALTLLFLFSLSILSLSISLSFSAATAGKKEQGKMPNEAC